jgi:hypothetical protein
VLPAASSDRQKQQRPQAAPPWVALHRTSITPPSPAAFPASSCPRNHVPFPVAHRICARLLSACASILHQNPALSLVPHSQRPHRVCSFLHPCAQRSRSFSQSPKIFDVCLSPRACCRHWSLVRWACRLQVQRSQEQDSLHIRK